MKEKIGFIGLGNMGNGMATNLVRAGMDLCVSDVSEAACEDLAKKGATVVSVQEMGENCDIILLSLPSGKIVDQVLFGEEGLAKVVHKDTLICDLSSVKPEEAESFAKRLREASGATYVDSPVSGGKSKATSGELSIMMGGPQEALPRLLPIYEIIGSAWYRVGEAGRGSAAKLCNQIIVTMNIAILTEALAFAEKYELELPALFDALHAGSANSAMLENRRDKILRRDFTPNATIDIHIKDISNVIAAAEKKEMDLPLTEVMLEVLKKYAEEGGGPRDSSSLLLYYEKQFGIDKED